MQMMTSGNTAKLYCLNEIARLVQTRGVALTILDLGCGEARNFTELLRAHPNVRYVGVEPSAPACRRAQSHLAGLNGVVHNASANQAPQLLHEKFDVAVSFSVLEHVYDRLNYLRSLKNCLKPDGRAFVNYDSGHFFPAGGELASLRQRLKNRLRPLLGDESGYKAFVREEDFRRWLNQAGLTVLEAKSFNLQSLKTLYKSVPESERAAFMTEWFAFEEKLNQMHVPYTDSIAEHIGTRNFILAHAC